jgi:hypothetical protein
MQSPDTNPIWTRARAMFARAVAMLGDAAAIAALAALTPRLRRQIVAWLAPLEHVVRKLLLAEAAALTRAEVERAKHEVRIERVPLRGMAQHWSAGLQTRMCTTAAARRGSEDPRSMNLARPETWREQFSFALPRPHYVPEAHVPRIRALWGDCAPPPPEPERKPRAVNANSPFRLARRFEALRRVLDNPAPHAERLARALAQQVRRLGDIVQRYVVAPCRTNDYDKDDPRLGLDAMCAAHRAAVFADSS